MCCPNLNIDPEKFKIERKDAQIKDLKKTEKHDHENS